MAIIIQEKPVNFFHVFQPAVFIFSTTKDLGVNPNDLVADLEMVSKFTFRRYVIKNIKPNYATGKFRIDISSYLKALMLDNFEFRFQSTNRDFTIERYEVNISIHAENVSSLNGDSFTFDSGLIFDDNFVFGTDQPSDSYSGNFFAQLGTSHPYSGIDARVADYTYILSPKYTEFCEGFDNTISVFVNSKPKNTAWFVDVGGVQTLIYETLGVATVEISEEQIQEMYLPAKITTTPVRSSNTIYGISYKPEECEETLMFRFYNSLGGFSYFFTAKQSVTASRGKSDFINNDFYNPSYTRAEKVQSNVDYSNSMALSGVKQIELSEAFNDLLRSPKIEVMLSYGIYVECKITGQMNVRKLDFEYNLNVDIANSKALGL